MAWMSRPGSCAIINSIAFVSVLSSSSCPLMMIRRSSAVSRGAMCPPGCPDDEVVGNLGGLVTPNLEGLAVSVVWTVVLSWLGPLGALGWGLEVASCGFGGREAVRGFVTSDGVGGFAGLGVVLHGSAVLGGLDGLVA